MLSKKLRSIVIVCIILATAAVYGLHRWNLSKSRRDMTYDSVKVDRGAIVAKVTASGTLSAIVTVQVGSQISGTISALYADFNSTVKKGQLIATIDPRLFDAAVRQARANLAAAEGNLAKAKAQAVDAARQYDRDVVLFARKLIAQADLDTAQSNADALKSAVDAAAGVVEQAKAQLNQAEVNLAYTQIKSPTDGVVISRNVDVGQTVAASLQAPTLFLIAQDLRKMQVDTSVAEADIGMLQSGMTATFTVDAYPAEKFIGTVRQIRNSPQTVQNVVTYDAVIDVDNTGLKLKPGMTANCTFIYAQRDDVLRIPNAVMRFRPPSALQARLNPGGREGKRGRQVGTGSGPGGSGMMKSAGGPPGDPDHRIVWVLRGANPTPLTIHVGITDGSFTEVMNDGLAEGDLVITDVSSGGTPAAQGGVMARRLF